MMLLAGFILSLLGSLPPGLISLSVAQTAIYRGMRAALWLGMGAAGAEFFQAWLAASGANWFLAHPTAARAFEWGAVPVFLGLGVYLIFWALPPRDPGETYAGPPFRQVLKGMLISIFNLLAIPYWFAYCGWLRLNGWWSEGLGAIWAFSAGAVLGTMTALTLYAWLGQFIIQHSARAALVANRVVGFIFLGLGFKALVQALGN